MDIARHVIKRITTPRFLNDVASHDVSCAIHQTLDYGPAQVPPEAGICMLGAVPWVCNYNVPIRVKPSAESSGSGSGDEYLMAAAKRMAKRVGERGGGLAAVQAMALPHGRALQGDNIKFRFGSAYGFSAVQVDSIKTRVERAYDLPREATI
jgi:hypothetical protein